MVASIPNKVYYIMRALIVSFLIIAVAVVCITIGYNFYENRAKIDFTYALAKDLRSYRDSNGDFPSNWRDFVEWASSGHSPRRWNVEVLSHNYVLNKKSDIIDSSGQRIVLVILDPKIKSYEPQINQYLQQRLDIPSGKRK